MIYTWAFKFVHILTFSGEQVVVVVKLEREDEEEVSPHVIAPFFPQVRRLFQRSLLCVCVNKVAGMCSECVFCGILHLQKREEGWWVVIGDPKSNK